MSEPRVTVNNESIQRKFREATARKLEALANEIVAKSQCDEHPDFRPTIEFNDARTHVNFRGACCDAFKAKIEAARESYVPAKGVASD